MTHKPVYASSAKQNEQVLRAYCPDIYTLLMAIICEVSVALTSDHTLGCTIPRNVVNIFLVFLAYKYDCL